jgi:hypothetical protein
MQDEYMPACMSELAGEYPDTKQRYALCMSAWNASGHALSRCLLSAPITPLESYEFSNSYTCDVVRVGKFRHPVHGWILDVTQDRIDHWVESLNKMLSLGVRPPLVKDHTVLTDTTLGFPVAAWRRGDRMMVRFNIETDAAKEAIKRAKYASIGQQNVFKDGEGREWPDAISHIGVTPEPVVTGQDGFTAIAASCGQSAMEIPVYSLATGETKMRKDLLDRFRAMLKLATETAEDQVLEGLSAHIDGKLQELKVTAEERDALKKSVAELQANAVAAAAGKKPELDPDTAEDRAADVASDIDKLVGDGKLQPAMAASLRDELCGTAEARNVHMLSLSPSPDGTGARRVRARKILAIIAQITPIDQKPKTGTQTFSRSAPDDKPTTDQAEMDKTIENMTKASDPATMIM